ncbi:MAG: MFS transporter [Candidatus Dormibacterales bacterium]
MLKAIPPPGAPARRARLLGALRHRNYRLFFTGQVISTVGTWMQSIAQSWLVLLLTHSALDVGLTLAAQYTPMLLGGPFGGLVADRFPKRRVLLVTQSLFMVPAFCLFAVSQGHEARFWMVLLAAAAMGTVNVFDVPARQAFVIEMVGREDLMNAIALNSSVFNAAAVVGPSLAGLLIAAVGVPICFLANSVSYLGAIAALAMMSELPVLVREVHAPPALERIREGAAYARRDPVVGMMLLTVAVFSLFAMNRLTLIPLFAQSVLGAGASGFGFLMASMGVGSVAGALTLAAVSHRGASGRQQFAIAVVWAVALLAFSASRLFWLSCLLLVAAGFCQISFLATANTRIQTATPDRLRGRVMSLYAQALLGVGPLGALQAGVLASLLNPPAAMAIGAVVAGVVLVAVRVARPAVFAAPLSPAPGEGGG